MRDPSHDWILWPSYCAQHHCSKSSSISMCKQSDWKQKLRLTEKDYFSHIIQHVFSMPYPVTLSSSRILNFANSGPNKCKGHGQSVSSILQCYLWASSFCLYFLFLTLACSLDYRFALFMLLLVFWPMLWIMTMNIGFTLIKKALNLCTHILLLHVQYTTYRSYFSVLNVCMCVCLYLNTALSG